MLPIIFFCRQNVCQLTSVSSDWMSFAHLISIMTKQDLSRFLNWLIDPCFSIRSQNWWIHHQHGQCWSPTSLCSSVLLIFFVMIQNPLLLLFFCPFFVCSVLYNVSLVCNHTFLSLFSPNVGLKTTLPLRPLRPRLPLARSRCRNHFWRGWN